MENLHALLNYILHIDQHLISFVALNGAWTYALLFLVIFCETGLVVTPILPGDSLLFAAGTIAASTSETLNIHALFLLLVFASFTGNLLNYWIGRFIGPKVFSMEKSLFFNPKYLNDAHAFYEKHGGKTIIIARFMPIIRTFAPFIAGIGKMEQVRFMVYNLLSAILWIGALLYTSFLFGNLPWIKAHFSTVIMAIIAVSLMPPVVGYLTQNRAANINK